MWGWCSFAAIWISRRNRSAPKAAAISWRSTLMATARSWRRSRARNTTAIPPLVSDSFDAVDPRRNRHATRLAHASVPGRPRTHDRRRPRPAALFHDRAGALRAVSRRARGCAGGWSARLGLQRARRAQHLDRDRPRVPGPRGDGLPGRRWAGDRGTRLDTRRTDARLRAWRPRQRTGRVPEPAVAARGRRAGALDRRRHGRCAAPPE